jgi:deazaflavin-dependent oxidoreductase (nitroreductase family)
VIKHTINPIAIGAARRGSGPFSLVEHVGRTSGARYETPIIVAPVESGFVAELTYGPSVAWYQNVKAAGGCVIRYHGRPFTIDRIDVLDAAAGLKAYGVPRSWVLRLLRRHEFLLLHVAGR